MTEPARPDDEERLEGRYANYCKVGYNAFEFLIDFGQFYPESQLPRLHTRIATSPAYAKAFSETMQESLHQYEERFGDIPCADDASTTL